MTDINKKLDKLVHSNASKAKDQDVYNQKYRKLCEDYNSCIDRIEDIKTTIVSKEERKVKAKDFLAKIKKQKAIKEFDQELFDSICECMTVYKDKEIKVMFKNGMEL